MLQTLLKRAQLFSAFLSPSPASRFLSLTAQPSSLQVEALPARHLSSSTNQRHTCRPKLARSSVIIGSVSSARDLIGRGTASSADPLRRPMASAQLSKRLLNTDEPVIIQMRELMKGATDVLSLAQGIVYWAPPEKALQAAKAAVYDPQSHGYGVDDGTDALRAALLLKIREENKLMASGVMVTTGAQQAFINAILSVCDPQDPVVLFKPYYFNHLMAFQMTGTTNILHGDMDGDLRPDADWLDACLAGSHGPAPKVVVVVNPGNPTGAYVPGLHLRRIAEACRRAGSWLIVDNTYEYFMYEGREHECVEGPHVINIFSFSKAYGMMGWRVGYIAYPTSTHALGAQLLKVQDTVPICANLVAQSAALAALEAGRPWVAERVATLAANRAAALAALAPLEEGGGRVAGGEGAIYVWARLPDRWRDGDRAVVKWLVERHGVCVIPGASSGCPGYIRVAFGNLDNETYAAAAGRLRRGLEELVERGMVTG